MVSKDVLNEMLEKYKNDPDVKKEVAGMKNVYQFAPSDGNPYYLSIMDGEIKLVDGNKESPTATVTAKDEVLADLFSGKIDPIMSYMTGKLKISGDLMSATKMTGLVKKLRK